MSPKEIEEVILSVDEVIDCTIKGREDELVGEAIEASVVLTTGADETVVKDKILRKCSDKLAAYKIPQYFEFTTNMSLSLTGKKVSKKNKA